MSTDKSDTNFATLLDIITEQRNTIAELKKNLDSVESRAKMYQRWWLEATDEQYKKAQEEQNNS